MLDRAGLEASACECYAVVKKELARLLSDVRYRQGLPEADALRDLALRAPTSAPRPPRPLP